MNERIKELAEQCGFRSNPDIYDRNQSFDIPKFAELIVCECVKLLDDEIGRLTEYGNSVDNEDYKADVDVCITKCIDNIMSIREHFGIKK